MDAATAIMLESDALTWRFVLDGAGLRSTMLRNRLTGRDFPLDRARELALVLSAAPDRLLEPLVPVDDFVPSATPRVARDRVDITLRSPSTGLEATLHYAVQGPTRRKWVELRNPTGQALLVLDVVLDSFQIESPLSGGGQGMPLFIGGEAFAAVEFPSGENIETAGCVTLAHFPGHLLEPGAFWTSHAAVISVAPAGRVEEQFVDYVDARSIRRRKAVSVYTPFGINNQWGPCPTLTDEETLDVLGLLGKWQRKGVKFDYLTLDTGWVDPSCDLTEFRPNAFPVGPNEITARVSELGMKFGLWFATSWAAESCWDCPEAWEGQTRPPMSHLNGAPDKVGFAGTFCFGAKPYAQMVRRAVLHHVRENAVRFIKFDGGSYHCDHTEHGHLPGRYSTERMYSTLIEIANAAREIAPEVFVMWYWGLRSPFWALHGDTVFESGVHLEGSGTSQYPTLYYRDSVTLAQDQAAQHAKLVPPLSKDSLGVWLADTRWGNFMGKERWREALVMDLGRGSLLFPNLWGDLYLLDEDDVDFLAWIAKLARERKESFLKRRVILGDPWRNEVYGYAHFSGDSGFLFINNADFISRTSEIRLDRTVGLDAEPGAMLNVVAHFPEHQRIQGRGGEALRVGDKLRISMRPFEVLMLEVSCGETDSDLPLRQVGPRQAADLGTELVLHEEEPDPELEVRFTAEARLRDSGFEMRTHACAAPLPSLGGPQPILAVAVQLEDETGPWKYSPFVAEIVQVRASIGGRKLQLMPVPDARQFGNTQHAGCSWVVYRVRLNPAWSGETARVSVGAMLPAGVHAQVRAWVVKRWWQESTRPMADGYYANAPS